MEDAMAFLAFIVVLCVLCGAGAWWSDRQLEKRRPRVPPPQRRAVVGETHKPWM